MLLFIHSPGINVKCFIVYVIVSYQKTMEVVRCLWCLWLEYLSYMRYDLCHVIRFILVASDDIMEKRAENFPFKFQSFNPMELRN